MDPNLSEILQARSRMEKQRKIEQFRRLNRYVRPGQILFAGSSLMEQFPINEFLMDDQLPITVYNRGVGGFTTQELLDHMDTCIYDLKPSHIFINIGTNDLNASAFDEDALISRYETILDGIAAHLPGTAVFVLAYYPVYTKAGNAVPYMQELLQFRTNARIDSINCRIRAMAKARGLAFLDLNEPLRDEDREQKEEYAIDGIHMYADGYRQVYEQLLPVLKTISE